MDKEREDKVLQAGMKAAQDQFSSYKQRAEYPRDFNRLYEWLEDKMFVLYEAIFHRKKREVYDASGEIVIGASRIAEFAKNELEWEELMPKEAEGE